MYYRNNPLSHTPSFHCTGCNATMAFYAKPVALGYGI